LDTILSIDSDFFVYPPIWSTRVSKNYFGRQVEKIRIVEFLENLGTPPSLNAVVEDHNQALWVITDSVLCGALRGPFQLINFDAHHDYFPYEDHTPVATWLRQAVDEEIVDKAKWVFPEYSDQVTKETAPVKLPRYQWPDCPDLGNVVLTIFCNSYDFVRRDLSETLESQYLAWVPGIRWRYSSYLGFTMIQNRLDTIEKKVDKLLYLLNKAQGWEG
jgi:hypothetical protein